MSTVQEISEAIEHLDVREQIRLLQDLPGHLKIQPDDVAWLKAAEPAFEFWNNTEDAIYDQLQNPSPKQGMSPLRSGGRLARRDEEAQPKRSVTEEQRRQQPPKAQPAGLRIFAAAAALLVGQRSIKDILPPRALLQRQISSNAPAPYLGDRFQQGDVVLVPFPFTDLSAIKQRPGLVISPDRLNDARPDLVVVAITSQIPADLNEDELRLPDAELAACGLPKPSVVKLGKIFTIHQGLIRKKLGHLPQRTLEEIRRRVAESLR